MKTGLLKSAIIAIIVCASASGCYAHSYNPGSQNEFTDPLRIVALPVHAAGTIVENVVLRPIHCFVSKPCFRRYFGHVTNKNDNYLMKENDLQKAAW
ncbi:hypothetical protein GX645_04665 [Candidatus Sumerlaeota bacterium]|nr:hypothetical protein [Candidatus Sumerlaeales bacterium]NLD61724.1 hypothetical protein [Candidatus Sumerlaeota bacterium]